MDLKLPSQDSATGRGLKTGLWSFIGTSATLATALWLSISGVPGCSDAILTFIREHFIEIAAAIALPSGLTSFIAGLFRKDIKNY